MVEKSTEKVRKKKKRKANKTGFPVVKKKKKATTPEDQPLSAAPLIAKKQIKPSKRKASPTKKVAQPLRASARIPILADKGQSDNDSSRPSSRISEFSGCNPSLKRPESTEPLQVPAIKRSKLYEDVDENIDCLATLPLNDMDEDEMEALDEVSAEPDQKNNKRKRKGIHLFKRNYLIAGLFSNFYKEKCGQGLAAPVPINKVVYNPDEHIHGLLPPPYYCGRQLRQKKEDFTLPHDLWWQHVNKQLPGRDVNPTWNYKRIKNNVYFDVAKPVAKGSDMQACPCKVDPNELKGCNEDCINR